MVESSKSTVSILPFPGIPSRLATAVLIQTLGYKHHVICLMNCLNKGSAKYVRDNDHMLDQFWVKGMKVKINDD